MNTQHKCRATTMRECPIADALVESALGKLKRRKNDDPVTAAIHIRLDALENLAADMKWIKEQVESLFRVLKLCENITSFTARWAWVVTKIVAAIAVVVTAFKIGITEIFDIMKAALRFWK